MVVLSVAKQKGKECDAKMKPLSLSISLLFVFLCSFLLGGFLLL